MIRALGNNILHDPSVSRGMRLIALKLIILKRIKYGAIYPYALMKELLKDCHISAMLCKDKGDVKNDIYNTIKALEQSGYIKAKVKTRGTKLKKYYTITACGNRTLTQAKLQFLKSMKALTAIIG
jgi:DNA-binding PadR family transcriptional regulator